MMLRSRAAGAAGTSTGAGEVDSERVSLLRRAATGPCRRSGAGAVDSDPYTDDNAVGATYIAFGDTRWVPDCGGFLAGLVRDTDGFRGISPEEVRPVILRLTVDAVEALRQVSGPR